MEKASKLAPEGAFTWGMSLILAVMMTMQISLKGDDITEQRITTVDGQVIYAWGDSELDIEQHIPQPRAQEANHG